MILSAENRGSAAMESGKRFNLDDASPLSAIAEAFEKLAKLINSRKINGVEHFQLRLDTFCDACSPISILFGCLGLAFKFAESEYVSKVLFSSPFFDLIFTLFLNEFDSNV